MKIPFFMIHLEMLWLSERFIFTFPIPLTVHGLFLLMIEVQMNITQTKKIALSSKCVLCDI